MRDFFISVIIPNYNHEQYLDQRLETVLRQTYRNFEVIILDDKSTDKSLEVIGKYKDDCRVSHIIVNENNSGGTFKQWQKGIELAKGDWIWIAESDDYCELNFLETLVRELYNVPDAVIAATNSEWVDENGQCLVRNCRMVEPKCVYEGRDFIIRRMVYSNDIQNASSAIFRRQTALQISQEYTTYKAAGDRLFWILLSEKGQVVRVNQYLNYFRQHNIKVSSRCEMDGTVFYEDKKIIDYVVGTGILRGLNKQRSYLHFQMRAFQKQYESTQVRDKVYKTWNCYGTWGLIKFNIRKKAIEYIDIIWNKWKSLSYQ